MEEENYQPGVARHLSQVDNSVEEEFVTPVQVTANGLEVERSETVETSSTSLVTEIKSTTTFSRQDTYIVDQEITEAQQCNGQEITEHENSTVSEEIKETVKEGEIKETVTNTEDPENNSLDDENMEDPGASTVAENNPVTVTGTVQDENVTTESETENKEEDVSELEAEDEAEDEVDEASLSSSGLHRQNTYTVSTLEVKESSAQVLELELERERFTETQQVVEYKYDREDQEDPLYKEPDEVVVEEREVVKERKVVEDQYVTAEEVRSQKHQRALHTTTVTEVASRGEPILLEETSLASLASLKPAEDLKDPEDGLERTSRDVDQLLKDIRDPNLDCSLDDIEAMIEGKNVTDWKEETNNRGSPEFAKAAALIDQNPDPGFDPNDPAVKGLEDWDDSNNLTASFDTEAGKPSKLKNVFKRMSRSEETQSLLNESFNNNLEKHREEEEDKMSAGCFGNTLLYIFLKIFD